MPKGYPAYHSRHDDQSLTIPQNFKVKGSRFYLPKVGWLRTVFHRPIEGQTKGFTVSKTKTGKYFVSVKVEKEMPEPVLGGPKIGIDLGLTVFATLSIDGPDDRIDHPQYFRQAEKKIKRLHRALSRKKKGSQNRVKTRLRLARAYEQVNCRRADFLHQKTRLLVDQYGHINIENLNVQGMIRNHRLAKSIQDSGWSEFARQLEYKGQWYGCTVERIDRWYPSSKKCSTEGCGYVNQELELKHRFWTCPECKTEHDREKNAATNIGNYEKDSTAGEAGTAFPSSKNGKGTPVEIRFDRSRAAQEVPSGQPTP
jgi:putative transposase